MNLSYILQLFEKIPKFAVFIISVCMIALICAGDYDEAEFWLREAINNPNYNFKYYSFFNLGGIFEIKGDWIEALKNYRKALKLNPSYDAAEKAVYRLTTLLN